MKVLLISANLAIARFCRRKAPDRSLILGGGAPYCIWPPHAKRELLSKIHRIGLPKYRKLFGGTKL